MERVREPSESSRSSSSPRARPRPVPQRWPEDAGHACMESPIGRLDLVVDARGRVLSIAFASATASGEPPPPPGLPAAPASAAAPVISQLAEYFAGDRRSFDLTVAPAGSAFQQRVWQALGEIPYGATISYGQLAARLGDGAHPRAVGSANGRNPVPIVIPCHRVIGADGRLTGYGGGLDRKRQLLALEGAAWRD